MMPFIKYKTLNTFGSNHKKCVKGKKKTVELRQDDKQKQKFMFDEDGSSCRVVVLLKRACKQIFMETSNEKFWNMF
jgi:hypothetical protein